MKRIILITFMALINIALYCQNDFKYQVRAFGGLSVGGNYVTKYRPVKIDSITSTGGDIRFWSGGAALTAVPGVGAATWGTITGTLSNQVDLLTALGLKADLISPVFTGTPIVPGYVPTSRTVNGHALSANVTVSATDVGLGNVTNESKATMFTNPIFTGTPTVPGYVPTSRTVNGYALTGNISITAADVSLGNVTNESKATMFTNPDFTGTRVRLGTDTLATKAYARSVGGGLGMVYPGIGIPLSTGAAWGTSITNNSTNWNTAYGWGNHAGLYLPIAGTATKATILETTRAIYGNDFNGSAALTQIIASTYGGTGNGYTKFTGPSGTEKTFTLPNANATLARTDAGQTFTGHNTFEGVTATGATGTGAMVFGTSPSFTTGITTPAITLGATLLTPNGAEFNYVDGVTSAIQPQLNARGRVFSDTMSVSAGVIRTKATTITTEPYSIMILDSDGNDITHNVKDSVALNGGVYKLYVYSVDALAGAKIKILY